MVEFPTSGPAAAFYLPSPAGPAGFGIKRGEEVQGGRVTGRGARGRPSRQKHHGGGKTKQENRVCFSVLKNRPVLFCAEGKRAVFSCLVEQCPSPGANDLYQCFVNGIPFNELTVKASIYERIVAELGTRAQEMEQSNVRAGGVAVTTSGGD